MDILITSAQWISEIHKKILPSPHRLHLLPRNQELQSSPNPSLLPSIMFKVLAILSVCAAVCSGSAISSVARVTKKEGGGSSILGVVSPVGRCGGVGTPLQLRISDCDGYCELTPGTVYDCEEDFMPSSAAASLTLKIEVCMSTGFCMQILETVLANSSVQPGFIYTAKYSIVPNDILAGQTVEFRAYISHSNNGLLEICVSADVDILFGVGR